MIRVEGASVDLGGRRALDDVSLELPAGRVTALLGPNGAGKTTLLRMMAGLVRPAAGRVVLEGAELRSMDRRSVARRVAVVLQEPPSELALTVRDLVLLGRHPHVPWHRAFSKRDREIAEALAAGMDLDPGRPMTELSAGERQLAHLARALAQEPRALLMDEPAANLDLRHQLALIERVRRLAVEGAAVLIILHDLNLAQRAADEAVILGGGRVLARGAPAEALSVEAIRAAFGVEARVVRLDDGRPVYSY
jgi:iron complex transport system ATP-binding protein